MIFFFNLHKNSKSRFNRKFHNHSIKFSAAHCTRAFENHYYEVRAGVLRRSSYSPQVHITKVTHVIRHEDYQRSTMKNDIALMRVKHHFNYNKWIRPICMPNKERTGIKDWMYGPKAGEC